MVLELNKKRNRKPAKKDGQEVYAKTYNFLFHRNYINF